MSAQREESLSPDSRVHSGYQFFMLVLSLYALGSIAALTTMRIDSEVRSVLAYADLAVCGLFFIDFLVSLWTTPDRKRYLMTWGWLDLLSCIPMVDAARFGRIARVVRIFRVIRGLRAARIIAGAVLVRRAENALLAAVLATLLLLTFCSIAMLLVEISPDSNIRSAEDAIWWSLSTITTVGYGDRFPVTSEGRVVAALLMLAGVALFTTISGLLAALFLSPGRRETSEMVALQQEISALRQELKQISLAERQS